MQIFKKCKQNVCYVLFCISYLTSDMAESKKPIGGRQQAIWRVECELAVITDPDCPVDGGWSPWSPWTNCYGTCDDVGHRQRVRHCINPPPSQDGLPCTGPDYETEPCYVTNCSVHDFRNIVKGDSVRTEALRQLAAVPSIMESCLQRDCSYEAIEEALAKENTWQIIPEVLWNSLLCVKRNLGCPEVGEWGPWGAWSSCGARCGYGLKWRLRRCDTPPPSTAHLICAGTPLQAEECQGEQCAVVRRDATGTWGNWGEWSPCSENCGTGVRRRKRNCYEMTSPKLFGRWGTHCRGQHDQMEVCENKECLLDGGWSGWGAWGPCSETCGTGKRSRSRSCTRPVPAGNGTPCIGRKTEMSSCNLRPCRALSHTVAIFNGESFLQYNIDKRSVLFHFYIRFLPLSPHGTLVRRGNIYNPLIRLSLQKWHLCLDANGLEQVCSVPRICSHTAIDPAVWHTALVTVTSEAVSMRIDDAQASIRGTFHCDPDFPDAKMNIFIGERLHGEIQEIILNFIPLSMILDHPPKNNTSSISPTKGSNVIYELASIEEAFLLLDNGHYLRLPCFTDQTTWKVSLTLKLKQETGTILFFQDLSSHMWLLLSVENMRLKLKLSVLNIKSQSISTMEVPPDQWFDVTLFKKPETNTFEATLNGGERLHVTFEDVETIHIPLKLCEDEYFVGDVPYEVKSRISENFAQLSGILAAVSVNNVLINIHEVNMERWHDYSTQVSSRTASISGYYHETAWGWSNHLNLTCLHARSLRSPNNTAYWLYLDVTINSAMKDKTLRSIDDGRVLRLVATANNNLRGFYTCRAHSRRRTRNIVTYGVIGKIQNKLISPDTTTAIAVVTTCTLVILTLGWLFVEGLHDIKNGYGFFRDDHMKPEEKAEAVCKLIDQNMHLIGSKSAAELAKAKARRIGKFLASSNNFGAQVPSSSENENESLRSSMEDLPALPGTKTSSDNNLYTCAPSYVSSPRHGSLTSPRSKLSSSYSDGTPRVIYSKLLLAKRGHSPRAISCKLNKTRVPPKANNLLTIKSSRYVTVQSPALKILEKFQQLKKDDS